MVSMMSNKIIFIYIIIIFLSAVLLVIGGCKSGSEDITDTAYETETIDDNENDGSEVIDPEIENGQIEQEDEEKNQEDVNSDEETVEGDNEPPESVELSAKHVGGDSGSITMFFDLKNGEVSGHLEMEYTEVSLDGNKTVICVYDIKGEISGTMDLESRVINAEFTGEADSEDKGCYKGELKFSMKGKISKDYSVARGTTTFGGVDWSVFD